MNKRLFTGLVAAICFSVANVNLAFAVQETQEAEKTESKKQSDETQKADPKAKEDSKAKEDPKVKEKQDEQKPKETNRAGRRSISFLKKGGENIRKIYQPVIKDVFPATVQIFEQGKTEERKRLAYGSIVDAAGFVLTKASELKGSPMLRLSDGRLLSAKVYGIHRPTDLAVLKVEASNLPTIQWADTSSEATVGTFVATSGIKPTPRAVGVVSVIPRSFKEGGVLGVQFDITAKNIRIDRVFSDSPAEKIGIAVNDVITQVNNKDMKSREQLIETVKGYSPGDRIEITIKRGSKQIKFRPILGRREIIQPGSDRSNMQNRMGTKLSNRRTGFETALQHDTVLNANDCGGALVNLEGKVVGINIARDGRVSSLAIPVSTIIPLLDRLKTGELSPALVNKDQIELMEADLADVKLKTVNLPNRKTDLEKKDKSLSSEIDKLTKKVAEMAKQLDEAKKLLDKKEREKIDNTVDLQDFDKEGEKLKKLQEKLKNDLEALRNGTFGQ